MSFLLDTDTCSAHLKRPAGLMQRFVQHGGAMYLSSIALGELYTWAYRRDDAGKLLRAIEQDLLADLLVLDFDSTCARQFGQLQSKLLTHGAVVNATDLMIATVALVHNLTLVKHNLKHFDTIPGLRLADWLDS